MTKEEKLKNDIKESFEKYFLEGIPDTEDSIDYRPIKNKIRNRLEILSSGLAESILTYSNNLKLKQGVPIDTVQEITLSSNRTGDLE
jgi:hypothetical protein